MTKEPAKRKGANGYKLPEPLPPGEILVDIAKQKWKLGPSIGHGGFGEIYAAKEADSAKSTFPYAVKIESHDNGPLFVEINFYIRNAKPQEVEEFKAKKKLDSLGMPTYIGSGSHQVKKEKYRFLVMQKFGNDIWKLFLENNKKFPIATVFKLGVQILDVLEYIHEHGYIHADVKGANLLLDESRNQVYLVDFGLATKYQSGNFTPNPKKSHDGTIEYLSRDMHKGVPTRRGDLEILAYNLIHWAGCTLPWEKNLANASKVQQSKEESMSDVDKFLKTCFDSKVPNGLSKFLKYINSLGHDEKPNYESIRKIFLSEIDDIKSPLDFGKKQLKRNSQSKKTVAKKLKTDQEENGSPTAKAKNKKIRVVEQDQNDEFAGYTPEMKALALKKKERNGRNDTKVKETAPASPETSAATTRRGRNVKKVNYTE